MSVPAVGGGYINVWEEDGFVRIATAPGGHNEYTVSLWPDDALRVADRIKRAAGVSAPLKEGADAA